MTVERIELLDFTAFRRLTFLPSPGVNVLLGENGTGKTHLMKVAYAACAVSGGRGSFPEKLERVFLPSENALGRLVHRKQGYSEAKAKVSVSGLALSIGFDSRARSGGSGKLRVGGWKEWAQRPLESVFIPVKEMLANGPGFRSLYARRDVHFEEIYADILDRAYQPVEKVRRIRRGRQPSLALADL